MNMVTSSVLGNLDMRKQTTQNTGLAYKQENERSGSERGSKASYVTKFPKISARYLFWSQISDTCRQGVRERNVGPETIYL